VPTPEVSEQTLPNGLRVLVASTHDVPLVSARLTFATGAADDPADKAGLAPFAAGLLSEGTSTQKAPEIAAELESLGAVVGASAGYDFTGVSANSPADVFPKTAALMAAITRDPTFADDELARAQQQSLDGLRVSLTEPGSIAGFVVARVLFGSAPYGAAVSGTPASIPRITRDDLVAFHGAHYRPGSAKLTFSGDIEPNAAFALAEQLFGDWGDPDVAAPPAVDAAGPVLPPRVVVIDQPGSGQAAVYAAARAIERTDPDFYPLVVANTVLGAGYSSRLNQEIRLKRGLSYGASSSLGTRLHGGVFAASAQTRNDAAVMVSDLMLGELTRIGSEPVPTAELDVRATALIGGFSGSLESVDGLVGQVASLAAYDLPLTELSDYPTKVRAVSPEQLQQAFGKRLPTSAFSLIIVGDAAKFLPALKAKHPTVEVIPVDELDLDSATLR
jgi:zinc protease